MSVQTCRNGDIVTVIFPPDHAGTQSVEEAKILAEIGYAQAGEVFEVGVFSAANGVYNFSVTRPSKHVDVDLIVDLWNRNGGWIPGAAYQQLAEVLGVDPDRLLHARQERQ